MRCALLALLVTLAVVGPVRAVGLGNVPYDSGIAQHAGDAASSREVVGTADAVIDVCATCAFTSIQAAVNSIPEGSVAIVRVAQGTYLENVVVNVSKEVLLEGGWDAGFTTRSDDPALTTITSGTSGIAAARAGAGQAISLTLDGFRLTGAATGDVGGGVAASGTGGGVLTVNLDNCLVTGNSLPGGGGGVAAISSGAGSVVNLNVNRTRVIGNAATYPSWSPSGGMYLGANTDGTLNVQLTNTLVADNEARMGGGIFVLAVEESNGNGVPGTVNLTLLNSTISRNNAWYAWDAWGGGLMMAGYSGTVALVLENMIVYQNNGADIVVFQTGNGTNTLDAKYSDIGFLYNYPGASGTVTLGPGMINADPLFVNAAGGDYHLQPGSPAVDSGMATGAPAVDLDERARPIGIGIDMGAYETPLLPPALTGAASRRVHGAAGSFNLALSAVSTNPTTEPRFGPAHTLVFTFDKAVTSGTATLTVGTASVGTPTFSGNEMIVPLTGVINQQYVTVAVSDVGAADGGTGGVGSIRIGFLSGDVSQNRTVTLADLGQVNAQIAQPVTAANYLKDVNASGTLSLADKGLTNTQITKTLPAP